MPWCNAFDNHMCVSLTGSWSPCCRFSGNKGHKIKDYSFIEFKNSEFFKNLKEVSKNTWHPGCIRCKLDEERTNSSYRVFFNNTFSGKQQIEFIEINLSNECNLTCRMCSSTYSTSWKKLLKNNNELLKYIDDTPSIEFDISQILSDIDLTHLKRIKNLGGEPFITPQIRDLFEYLDNRQLIENLIFECNTNCTLFPDKWVDYLKRFKKLQICLSVDGYGPLNDYIRHGKSWDVIEKNIYKWKEFSLQHSNVELDLFATIQAYNLHNIKQLKHFCNSVGIKFTSSVLRFPEYLSINVLPKEYLDLIKDAENEIYYKSISYKDEEFKVFKEYTKKLDKIHNVNYRDVIPSLEKFMEK